MPDTHSIVRSFLSRLILPLTPSLTPSLSLSLSLSFSLSLSVLLSHSHSCNLFIVSSSPTLEPIFYFSCSLKLPFSSLCLSSSPLASLFSSRSSFNLQTFSFLLFSFPSLFGFLSCKSKAEERAVRLRAGLFNDFAYTYHVPLPPW